jgi:hypothetical protein
MEFLKSSQERDASVIAEFVKEEVLAKVMFLMSKKNARYEGSCKLLFFAQASETGFQK